MVSARRRGLVGADLGEGLQGPGHLGHGLQKVGLEHPVGLILLLADRDGRGLGGLVVRHVGRELGHVLAMCV